MLNGFRLLSLDVFRGIAIALMILVNSPGNSSAYTWLHHSEWNGCTLADLVFPFFLFIVGVSLVFSLTKSRENGVPKLKLSFMVFRRALLIFLIGIFLNAFPDHFNPDNLRYFGVLQRIAICYFFCSILFLTTRIPTHFLLMAMLLVVYWLLMMFVPVPGFGSGNLTLEANWAAYIDRQLFSSSHLYKEIFDPEGFLSTLPALATTLLGMMTGTWLLSQNTTVDKLYGMRLAGMIALIAGWFWGLWFPINKSLWTSSYVLWTGGIAILLLTLCYWLIDVRNVKRWSRPFEIFGVNALAAYFLHSFFLKIQSMITFTNANGSVIDLRQFITDHIFGWASAENASFMYAATYLGLWLLLLSALYKKRIFIKV